uniref:Caspase family p20 domain-containing protein n=1 Tax=Ciona savignyi TaxID=51511 RepID=H2YHT1_CIOSA
IEQQEVQPIQKVIEQQEVQPIHIDDISIDFDYKMDHGKRGLFVIFNQKEFKIRSTTLKKRDGTDIDAASLKKTAELLGFEVKTHQDLERKQILDKLWDYADMDHNDHDCFACAILTHGGRDDVLYAADDKMELRDLTEPFQADKCKSLAGKPKLFFVQACRGVQLDQGQEISVSGTSAETTDALNTSTQKFTIPVEADFLIAQATAPGRICFIYYAWRNKHTGSTFIQTLCSVLKEYGHELDLNKLLTRVNGMVAFNFESWCTDEDMKHKKQIPTFTSRLTYDLYFPK